jgi:uncharacterized protein YjiS (DUF1127 family)
MLLTLVLSAPVRFLTPATRVLARTGRNVLTVLANRRAVGRLSDLDDRQLKDIGLIRTDVAAALAEPLYEDPSCQLMRIAGERRTEVQNRWQESLRRQAGLVHLPSVTLQKAA